MTFGTTQGPDGILRFGAVGLIQFDGERWLVDRTRGITGLRALDYGPDGRIWAGAFNEIGWYEKQPNSQLTYRSLRAHLPKQLADLDLVWHTFAEGAGAIFVTSNRVIHWDGTKIQYWDMPGARRLPAWRSRGVVYFSHKPTGIYAVRLNGPELIVPAEAIGSTGASFCEQIDGGFLAVTPAGLFRYSSGRSEPIAPAVSELLRHDILASALRLPDGRLAIGTNTNGLVLVRPDGTIDRIISEKNGPPFRSVYSLYLDRENALWLTSPSGVAHLALNAPTETFGQLSGLPEQPVDIIVRHKGKLVVASASGVFEFNPTEQRFQLIDPAGRYSKPVDLLSMTQGLIAADYGFIRIFNDWKPTELLSNGRDNYVVRPSVLEPTKVLAIADHAIMLLGSDSEPKTLVQNLTGYSASLAEDPQGRIWIGNFGQGTLLARPISTTAVEAIKAGAAFGLPDKIDGSVVAGSSNGTVLNFTAAGGWIKGPAAERFVPIENCPPRQVTGASIASDDGNIWIIYQGTETRLPCVARILIQGDRAIWEPHSVEGLEKIGSPRCIFAEAGPNHSTDLWIGGSIGMLRTRVSGDPIAPKPQAPLLKALARFDDSNELRPITQALPYSTRVISFEFAEPVYGLRPQLRLETKLDGVDRDWMPADASSRRELNALRDGLYTFRVRAVAETGVTSDETNFGFVINPPWWRTIAALTGGLLALAGASYGVFRWRIRRLRRRNAELEAKVTERTAQLAQASAAKSQFLANMSHDIRNPLNGIVGLALALEDTPLDSKQGELVSTLRECTFYLSTLIDDVLDFAAIEAGHLELHPELFAPAELLHSVETTMKTEAAHGGSTLCIDIDPLLAPAYFGDAGRIQQILVNFVSNALKYAGGPVTISAVFCAEAPELVEFSVADEGPGISADDQERLFQKFSRLNGARSSEVAGTGLGLASCRLLAERMGGSVGVLSESGQGACFFLRLPLEARAWAAAGRSPTTFSQRAVLLVEDLQYNIIAARAVLGKLGMTCDHACSGTEALKLFDAHRYDIVLLDRNLPDMDGTEVARRIRSHEADGRRVLLLAFTAYSTTEDRAQCLAAGMDAFVGKPLTPEKLRRVLNEAGRRQLIATAAPAVPKTAKGQVDLSLLEYISDGTGTGLVHQIELFIGALDEADRQLAAAAESLNLRRTADAAHGVLSHARLVGHTALGSASIKVEDLARVCDAKVFDSPLRSLRREISRLRKAMQRQLASAQPK